MARSSAISAASPAPARFPILCTVAGRNAPRLGRTRRGARHDVEDRRLIGEPREPIECDDAAHTVTLNGVDDEAGGLEAADRRRGPVRQLDLDGHPAAVAR